MNRIIYPNNNNTISVVIPAQDSDISIVVKKDVPNGVPYKIVSVDDIPSDRTFRNAWTVDFSNPDGYGEGEVNDIY